ncbi:MAG: carboxypeptidase regulatory-like domain-containing protein [Gemmatimonadota bacterium]|nr:carboxypeptidase regulatory-like domain-containing protein [Gemmatimonadota bacterium]
MDTVVGHRGYGTLFLLASSLALAAGSPLDTHAQIVRGRLLDAEGRSGISGAMITLLDRQGTEVRRTLSRSSGLYQLIAPAPGAYRLRADRIGYWRIRMPLARLATSPLTGREVAVLDGIEVEGGDVIRAHENDGAVALLESGPRGRIVGSVLDTLNAGLPGARVFIVGTGIESRTDREGRFELGRLDPGAYAVNFSHPYLQSLGYVPEPVEVEVMADAEPPPEVHFATPTVRWIVEAVCRDEKRPEPLRVGGAKFPMDGYLIGQVTDHAGNPVPGETVRILWTRYGLGETEDQTRVEARRAFSLPKTNAAGNYIACWVPLDTRLEIAVVETGEGASLEDLDANELRTRQYTIVIPVSAGLERLDLRLGADPKPVRHARTGRGLVWRPYARAHGSTRG